MTPLLLASGSEIRAKMLRAARVPFEVVRPRIDEDMLRRSMEAEGLSPREMADHLAESKAMKAAGRAPEALVLGCDQVLEFQGAALAKPESEEQAVSQILAMSGKSHTLHSAAVLVDHTRPVWRHVESVTMTMRQLSPEYVRGYVIRNWAEIRHCVGGYQVEAEGARLFVRMDGDFFAVLGLPFLQLLDHLALRGVIDT